MDEYRALEWAALLKPRKNTRDPPPRTLPRLWTRVDTVGGGTAAARASVLAFPLARSRTALAAGTVTAATE